MSYTHTVLYNILHALYTAFIYLKHLRTQPIDYNTLCVF